MRRVDIIVGVFFVAFGVFWARQAGRFEYYDRVPGPGFLPMTLAVVIIGLGALLAITRVVRSADRFPDFRMPSRSELRRAGTVGGMIAVATATIPYLGFVVALMVLIGLLLFGLEQMWRTPRQAVTAGITTVGVPMAAYWLFGMMLGVRLPTGPLGI